MPVNDHGLSPRALTALFVFALALRLGYLALVWTGPLGNADSAAYKALAVTVANGRQYQANESAGPGGFPTDLQRPPGYPAFLVLVNFSQTISNHRIALVQCLLGALFAILLAHGFGVMTAPFGGLLAGLFYATDWITIVHTPMLIPETIYSITLGIAILVYALALKKPSIPLSCLAGLLLGMAALLKPAAQLVVLAFLAGWAFQRPRHKTALLFLVAYLACVAPWMMRNERKYGIATLSEIGTADLYFYTAQGSLHAYSLSDVAGTEITQEVNRLDQEWRAQALSVGERSRRMRHDALGLIVGHWPTVVWQGLIGLARTSLGTAFVTASDSMRSPPSRIARTLLSTLPLVQIAFLWLMAIYGFLSGVLSRGIRVLLITATLAILLPSAAPLAQSRFRVPAVPALSLLAGAAAIRLKQQQNSPTHAD